MTAPHVIFIATPLEAEHVARIRATAGSRAEIVHEADLHPPVRYRADHVGVAGFRRTPDQEERWRAHMARATILWDFPPRAAGGPQGLADAPLVRWVQTTSAGVGQAVARMGLADSEVVVTTASGVHADALAEFVMLALLAHVKDLPRLRREQSAHHWERYCCGELTGQTLLIVGAGKIGRRVADLARAFGMRSIGILARPDASRAAELGLDRVCGQDELMSVLPEADAVVLSVPHTADTEGMISRAAIARMKHGVTLVNVARGVVIDEEAMIEALRDGRIGFAALDVAAVEPLPPTSPLWDMDNVLVSPHSASTAPSENAKITDIFCRNLEAYLAGRPQDMINVLDKKRLY